MSRPALDVDGLLKTLFDARRMQPGRFLPLDPAQLRALCSAAQDVFMARPMLLRIPAPVQVCGDVHGQFFDLLRIFELGGAPAPDRPYLFLGDYVDRGKQSIETIALLFALKVKFPDAVHLLRGNHEAAAINKLYGFFDECKRRYNVKLWKSFVDAFNCMPVAAIVDGRIFCAHGGISPELCVPGSLAAIEALRRPTDVPDAGLLCDLLWSDPDRSVAEWAENDRGVSWTFGVDALHTSSGRTSWTWSCGRTRSWRTATSSLATGAWSPSSPRPTTCRTLTTRPSS